MPHRPREKGRGIENKPSDARMRGKANKCPLRKEKPRHSPRKQLMASKEKKPRPRVTAKTGLKRIYEFIIDGMKRTFLPVNGDRPEEPPERHAASR